MSLRLQDFRSDIVRSSTNGLPLLARVLQSSRKPKIAHLHLHILIQEQIAQLKVSMDDLLAVEVFQRMQHLQQIILNLGLTQLTLPLQQIIQSLR